MVKEELSDLSISRLMERKINRATNIKSCKVFHNLEP